MILYKDPESFDDVMQWLRLSLIHAPVVDTGEWQSIQDTRYGRMIEVEDASFEWPIPPGIRTLQSMVEPNLPWAEDHFMERVSGEPLNPPPSHEYWPFTQKNNDEYRGEWGQFSHTYPERFWPRMANVGGKTREGRQVFVPHVGIRFEYGDLGNLVELLRTRPHTRQAFLPIWFPEDLQAATDKERVPCSLGYHFMIRRSRLKCVYYIRSCDLVRHFRDDVYMAARLTQWITDMVNQLWVEDAGGHEEGARELLKPGNLVMHISSLHAFETDRDMLRFQADQAKHDRLMKGGW